MNPDKQEIEETNENTDPSYLGEAEDEMYKENILDHYKNLMRDIDYLNACQTIKEMNEKIENNQTDSLRKKIIKLQNERINLKCQRDNYKKMFNTLKYMVK